MSAHRSLTMIGLLLIVGVVEPTPVVAQIPVIWGKSEGIAPVAELGSELEVALEDELGAQVEIGFYYERFHVFMLEMWTWNGKFVLYEGDRYWELDEVAWKDLLGKHPSEEFSTPFLYRFPLGLIVLIAVGILGFVTKRVFRSNQDKVKRLLKSPHYQSAAKMQFESNTSSGTAHPSDVSKRSQEAIDYLVGQGIAADVADKNLKLIAECIQRQRDEQIDDRFEQAAMLDQQGQWQLSAAAYQALLDELSADDERRMYAENCLADVKGKQKESES